MAKPLFTADMVKTAMAQPPQAAVDAPTELGVEAEPPAFANQIQPQSIQPGQPLRAGATMNVNPGELALRSSILGFMEVPETLTDFVGGIAQQGIPQEQRSTAADWLHQIGIPQSPREILESPQYQQQVQAAGPMGGVASGLGQFGGGMAFPIGLLGQGAKLAAKGAKYVPGVAKMAAPIAQGVGKAMQGVNPMAKAAAANAGVGAGYGLAFGQGKKFGDTKGNLTPQEALTQGGIGGATGAGLGALLQGISQKFSGAGKAAAAQDQPIGGQFFGAQDGGGNYSPKTTANLLEAYIAKNPEKEQRAIDVAAKRTAKRGDPYREPLSEVQKKAALRASKEARDEAKYKRNTERQDRNFMKGRIFKDRDKRETREYREQEKNMSQAQRDQRELERRQYNEKRDQSRAERRQGERQENRQYTEKSRADQQAAREKSTQENRKFTEQRDSKRRNEKLTDTRDKEGKAGSRTSGSNEYYEKLYDKISTADHPERLSELEKRIYSSPQSKDGSRLLDNDQRQNLAKQLRKRNSELKASKKAKPGESEERQPAKPDAPKPAAGKTTPETPAPAPQEKATPGYKTGDFRKQIRNREKPREKRHEGALSTDSIALAGKLSQQEREMLNRSIDEIAEAHVEMAYARKELESLAEWGLKNESQWKDPSSSYELFKSSDGLTVAKAGAAKGFLLRAKIEKKLSQAHQQAESKYRDELIQQGVKRGDIQPKTTAEHMEVVVGGKADHAEITDAGKLKVLGMQKIQPPKREMPKNVQEMYERIERLKGRIKGYQQDADALKEEVLPLADRVFKAQAKEWAANEHSPAETPTFNVWHKDDHGHVTTITFKQNAVRHEFNDATADLKAKFDALHEKFLADSKREETIHDVISKSTKGLNMMTGFEPLAVGMVLGKQLGKRAGQFTKQTQNSALFVGTLRDILKAHPQFDGTRLANKFDEINGRILQGFAERGHRMVPISGGEDLTALLNKFKGVKVEDIPFAKIPGVTQAERETASLIRKAYKELAQTIEPVLNEMKARSDDLQFGVQAGRPKYPLALTENGKLRRDIHSKLYQEALQQMYDAAMLKGKHWEMASDALANLFNRKNASVFGNNPKIGLANFIDPLPMTIVEYGRHWLKASIKVNNKEIKAALKKLPIVPQADLTTIEMEQRKLLGKPAATNVFEKLGDMHENLNDFLGSKLDPIFKGKEKLTGMADKRYTRTAFVASVYRQAKNRGIDGDRLLDAILLNKGSIDPGLKKDVFKAVSADLAQLFNTLNPTINRDLFSDSLMGKVFGAYSRPQRRVGRYIYNLMKSDSKADKAKFAVASLMYLGMGGRAMLPTSVRNMMIYTGAIGAGFSAKDAVDTMQNLDKSNALEAMTGWDLSDRISYDAINIASPAIDDLEGLVNSVTSYRPGETMEQKVGRTGMQIVTGLALIPKFAGFGVGYLNSVANNFNYAAAGSRPVYVKVGPVSKKVSIPYDHNDAIRDSILAGPNPKGKAVRPLVEQALAAKIDAKRNSIKSALFPSGAEE